MLVAAAVAATLLAVAAGGAAGATDSSVGGFVSGAGAAEHEAGASGTFSCAGRRCAITFTAAKDVANRLSLSRATNGDLLVIEPHGVGAPTDPDFDNDGDPECVVESQTRLRCDGTDIGGINGNLRDRSDRLNTSAAVDVFIGYTLRRTGKTFFFNGGSGKDRMEGGQRGDGIRGNKGGDKLFGMNGRDALFGGDGPDLLNGGKRADFCNGGGGRDHAKSCKFLVNVP
jgi:hypothetical protein